MTDTWTVDVDTSTHDAVKAHRATPTSFLDPRTLLP